MNTWQPYELPSLVNRIPESYAKVEITPETCCRDRKRWDKSNKNFWNIYEYIITAIRLIGIFLTKQASRLKWITLQTTNSFSVKAYTLVKIGVNSSPMVEKHIHKSHGKFRNGHSYLEWCILGFKEYLHTLMFRWRHWRLTATPSGNVHIRRTGIMEYQSGLDHSHSMVSVMLFSLNLLFCYCMHLFRLRCFTVSLKDMLCWLIALNLIWLYICWHKYVRIPLCDEYKHFEYKHYPYQVSLTLTLSLSLSLYSLLLLERIRIWSGLELPSQLGIVRNLFLYSLSLFDRFRLWSSLELPSQLGIVRNLSLYSLLLLERLRLWSSLELPSQLGIVRNLSQYSLLFFERFRLWSSLELPSQLGIVRNPSLYSLLLFERFRLWSSRELPSQLGIVRNLSLYSLLLLKRFRLWSSLELPSQLGIVRILYSLSLSLSLSLSPLI